jgi:hypothetical protein
VIILVTKIYEIDKILMKFEPGLFIWKYENIRIIYKIIIRIIKI